MINQKLTHLLYIEPQNEPSEYPLNDDITQMYEYIISQWDNTNTDKRYRGIHRCSCGAMSDNLDHTLINNIHYNSLGLHYLQYHRDGVPTSEIEKIKSLYNIIKSPNEPDELLYAFPETDLYYNKKHEDIEDIVFTKITNDIKTEIDMQIIQDLKQDLVRATKVPRKYLG